MRTRRTLELCRDAESVFTYLARVENEAQWRHSIVGSRYVGEEDPAVGVRGETQMEVGGREVTVRWEVTEFVPGRTVAWVFDGEPCAGGGRYALVPTVDGCRLTTTIDVRLPRAAMLLEPVLYWHVSRGLRSDLARLGELLSGVPLRRSSSLGGRTA